MCLAGEVSQGRRTPQSTRAVHEFSHNATLRVAKVGRKQSRSQLTENVAQMNGEVLDGS